jgi:hypothetical protein
MNLLRGIVQMVVASDDVGDIHVNVIGDDSEVISRRPVRAHDDEVVKMCIFKNCFPLDEAINTVLLPCIQTNCRTARCRFCYIPAAVISVISAMPLPPA